MKKAAFLKSRLSGATSVLVLTLTLLVAGATATAGHHEIPSLKGVWKGTNYTLSDLKGYKQWEKTIHITEQKDRRFSGHFVYAEGRKNFFRHCLQRQQNLVVGVQYQQRTEPRQAS